MRVRDIIKLLFTKPFAFLKAVLTHFPYLVSDKIYVNIQYKAALGKFPNLKNPVTYTEKLQWLKLYDHKSLYTTLVDKVKVKSYVANLIGEKYIIPTLYVWDSVDQIDKDSLPEQFVLKCNHTGGGSVFICRDKKTFDFANAYNKLRQQLRMNTFLRTREWPYKNVDRKILCEKYMEDESGELRDYKFYCFDGVPKLMLVASNRFTNHNFNYYDMDFNPMPITSAVGEKSDIHIDRPVNFDEMKEVATKLSKGFPHIRVDLYNINGHIYFGELTFYDSSGLDDMNSDFWNSKMGSWITL